MSFSLTVETRTVQGKKLAQLREAGKIPAVIYGANKEAIMLAVDKVTFEKMFKQTGESSIITLQGLTTPQEVLVHDVAFDARRGGIVHIDFYAVEAGKEITVEVPLEFIGEAPAVKRGGTLTKVLHEVTVTCTPQNLPQHITVNVQTLTDFEQQILISDLQVAQGVSFEHEADEVVALVQPVDENVDDSGSAPDMSTIGVEKKGKGDA